MKNSKGENSATGLGDLCIRVCDSTAILHLNDTVTINGDTLKLSKLNKKLVVSENFTLHHHYNFLHVDFGHWSMEVKRSGSHFDLIAVKHHAKECGA